MKNTTTKFNLEMIRSSLSASLWVFGLIEGIWIFYAKFFPVKAKIAEAKCSEALNNLFFQPTKEIELRPMLGQSQPKS